MNSNTKRARSAGFVNMAEMMKGKDGRKVFSGQPCDTSWDNPNSKRKSPKKYAQPNKLGKYGYES